MNPYAVIAKETGQDWSEGVEIEVLEPTPEKLHLVLPLKVEDEEIPTDKLPAKELDAVAGGLKVLALLPDLSFSKTHNPRKCG